MRTPRPALAGLVLASFPLVALALLAFARAEAPVPAPEAPVAEPAPAPLVEPPPAREKLKWLVLPNLSYDTDDKLGFGVRAEIIQPRAGLDPYRSSFVVHLFATTNGYHHHRFRFDLVGLGPEERMRVTGHFALRAWLNDGYWGIGNGTEREVAYQDAGPDDPARKRYRYSLVQPFGQVAVRHALSASDGGAGPFSLYGSVNVRYSVIDATAASLLAEQQPVGMGGGLGVQLIAGALWDTRAPEVTPDSGWLLEVAGRGVTGAYTFGGPFVSARGWGRITRGVVVAQRVMAEWLFGEIPFYEMVFWGGVVPIPGMGGSETLRGVAFGRWRGPGKAVSNTELRLDVLRHRALAQELRWQLVPFVDLGAVWGSGDDATAPDPALPIHPAVGGGVRAIWGESIVGRVDAGVSPDLTDEGPALQWGFYLMFDHLF